MIYNYRKILYLWRNLHHYEKNHSIRWMWMRWQKVKQLCNYPQFYQPQSLSNNDYKRD